MPACAAELCKVLLIAAPVAFDLGLPKGREPSAPRWVSIAVPEIAIDEHDDTSTLEDEIGSPRQLHDVLAIPNARLRERPAHEDLDPRVESADARHVVRTLRWRVAVGQRELPRV
jgi:hypothetical protein